MLGKIIKHEFKATYKTNFMVFISMILLAILVKMLDVVPMYNGIWNTVKNAIAVIYVLILIMAPIFAFILSIERFYRTMTKDEAYLTHTIPAKKSSIIIGKLCSSAVWIILSVVMIFVSLLVLVLGSEDYDVFRNIADIIKFIFSKSIYVADSVSLILMLIITLIATILLFYTSVTLGCIIRGHRILGAVIFYFVLEYIFGFVTIVMINVMPGVIDVMNRYEDVADVFIASDNGFMLLMLFVILMELFISVVCYTIVYYFFTKKINLE